MMMQNGFYKEERLYDGLQNGERNIGQKRDHDGDLRIFNYKRQRTASSDTESNQDVRILYNQVHRGGSRFVGNPKENCEEPSVRGTIARTCSEYKQASEFCQFRRSLASC